MSLRITKNLKLTGAAGAAAALALGTIAAPALAASHDLSYLCDTLGPTNATLDVGTIPATMVAGQTSTRTMHMVVHLDQTQTGAAQSFGTSVNGKAVASGANNTFPFKLIIPDTAIPQTTGATMDVPANGPGTIRPLKAGTWTVTAGDMVATLNLSGGVGGTQTLTPNCLAPTDSTANFGTITVSKDKTKSAVSASYSKATKAAHGKAKVTSHFGLKPTGKVKFTLKKGTHAIKSISSTLNKKGVAKATFKGVKAKGKYSIVGKYAGDHDLKGSHGSGTFTVS
jgi:hypothetical protein